MICLTEPDSLDKASWQEFVFKHQYGNYFQTPQIHDFFLSVHNYDPVLVASKDKRGEIIGIMLGVIQQESGIKSFLSSRCIIWGGPLIKNGHEDILSSMLDCLINMTKTRAIYIEVRNFFPVDYLRKVFNLKGFRFNDHLNYVVKIETEDLVKARISKSKLRQIKKGQNAGAEITVAESITDVKDFYSILKELYKVKIKKPLPDFSFFENFFKSEDNGVYLIIRSEQKIIGGMMCPIYKDTIYEWYIASLDREYNKLYPGVLATWAPIKYALENDLHYFDFMGAGSPESDYGVQEFKSKFGGELVNYGRFLRINKPFLYNIGKKGLSVYQRFR